MTAVFAEGDAAVVALLAIAGIDAHMVEDRICKARDVVAVRTILAVRIGRYMIIKLADADHVVVTGVTARHFTGMVITTRAESSRLMTDLAVLGADRHVLVEWRGQRYTGCIDSVMAVVTALGQNGRIRVVDVKCREEALGVVAGAAISRGSRVRGHG